MNTEKSCTTSRGFTLLELLVVVLIIGLLTSIVAPRFMGQVSRSEVVAAKAQLDAIDKALLAYRVDMGTYPSTGQGLAALTHRPADASRWQGPYLKGLVPPDPWGTPYQYRFPAAAPGKDFDLLSLGKDKAPGGVDLDADIIQ